MAKICSSSSRTERDGASESEGELCVGDDDVIMSLAFPRPRPPAPGPSSSFFFVEDIVVELNVNS